MKHNCTFNQIETCICHYLLVGANISQSESPSKLLSHCHGLVIHNCDPGPSWSTPHQDGEHIKKFFRRPPIWPPPWEASKGVQPKLEAQSNLSSSLFQTLGTVYTKTDVMVVYGLGFGRTLYGWKDNSKTLPMVLVPGPNSSVVDGNHPRKLMSRLCPGAASLFLG